MIKVHYDTEILSYILKIEERKAAIGRVELPFNYLNKVRKNTKKLTALMSNKIEGNPLDYKAASEAISSKNRHLLKPEQEVRNYFNALTYLEDALKKRREVDIDLLLTLQKIIVEGEGKEKVGIRNAMPAGFVFAVYDNKTKNIEYIPPAKEDIEPLLNELFSYLNNSSDHPLIKVATLHYQLVTIHPFEDGNGRSARLLSSYYLDLNGYGFANIGSLEEYFYYNLDEYYKSLQMGLPPLYYEGRNEPLHPNIWFKYYLRMFDLYSSKVLEVARSQDEEWILTSLNHLNKKEKQFLLFLLDENIYQFSPIYLAKRLKVSNRTIINWSSALCLNNFLVPHLVNKRTTHYGLSKSIQENKKRMKSLMEKVIL